MTTAQLISKVFSPRWHEGLTNEQYHADKTRVSSSSLKAILKSDKEFYASFYGPKEEPTPSQKIGTLSHSVLLDKIPLELGDFKTKTEQRIYDKVKGITEAVRNHAMASALLEGGYTERTGFYRDHETGISCRIRPDLYNPNFDDLSILVDLKTCSSIEIRDIESQIWGYRYDISMEMYAHGIEAIDGKYPDNIELIFVENTYPHEVVVVDMCRILEKGRAKNDYFLALKRLKKAIVANTWTDRHQDLISASYPAYVDSIPMERE